MEIHGLSQILRRFFASREVAIDPATLSRGRIIQQLGRSTNRYGRPVHLIEVEVIAPREHHKRGDWVIWEIPLELELQQFPGTREEKLRAWYRSME